MNLGHAHKTRFWYLLGVLSKFCDERLRVFYRGVPSPPTPRGNEYTSSCRPRTNNIQLQMEEQKKGHSRKGWTKPVLELIPEEPCKRYWLVLMSGHRLAQTVGKLARGFASRWTSREYEVCPRRVGWELLSRVPRTGWIIKQTAL